MNMVSDVRFALNDSDEFLVSASYDKTCRIWSARDFASIKTLRGHEDKVSGVDVSRGIFFFMRFCSF
jgi:U4/U6 small nuclear ribonucleoprotein PRP4